MKRNNKGGLSNNKKKHFDATPKVAISQIRNELAVGEILVGCSVTSKKRFCRRRHNTEISCSRLLRENNSNTTTTSSSDMMQVLQIGFYKPDCWWQWLTLPASFLGHKACVISETAKSVDQVKLNRTANTELWVHIVSDSFCPGWDYSHGSEFKVPLNCRFRCLKKESAW